VKLDDEALLVGGDAAAAEVRVEVVDPPEAAALAGAPQTCSTVTEGSRMQRDTEEEKKANG
jgi:hypothetical protein